MIVEPKVFLIGESTVNKEGLSAFLTHLGVPEWTSDAGTDIELLTEVYGRACYKSFGTDLNPNSRTFTDASRRRVRRRPCGGEPGQSDPVERADRTTFRDERAISRRVIRCLTWIPTPHTPDMRCKNDNT